MAVRIWVWIRGVAIGVLGGVLLGLVAAVSRDRLMAGGLEFWLENVGGPWIATAFVVGALSRRRGAGALAGVIALLTAVTLYDLTKAGGSVVHASGGVDFSGAIMVRQFWLAAGALFGGAFGGLGGWWGERPGRNWIAPGLAAGAVAGEALALAAGGFPHPRFQGSIAATQP